MIQSVTFSALDKFSEQPVAPSYRGASISNVVFYPLRWIGSKTVLTTGELELFEKLVEGVFWGGASVMYDLSLGERKLAQIDTGCDALYGSLNKKWFPNAEGILFLRQNLLKIQLRVCTALGREEKVEATKQEYKRIAGEIPEEIASQIRVLKVIATPISRLCIRVINVFAKGVVFLLLLFSRKSA